MFKLVDEAEHYPEFLPWCSDAVVHHRDEKITDATLEMKKAGLTRRFRTRNENKPGESIRISLVDGPFRTLQGEWRFKPLGEEGSKVSLDLEFDFDNRMTDRLLGPFFEDICSKLVNAFTERAATVYGA